VWENQSALAVSSSISWWSEFQYESALLKLRLSLFKSLLEFSILKFDPVVFEKHFNWATMVSHLCAGQWCIYKFQHCRSTDISLEDSALWTAAYSVVFRNKGLGREDDGKLEQL
jgi:hypothetical protein